MTGRGSRLRCALCGRFARKRAKGGKPQKYCSELCASRANHRKHREQEAAWYRWSAMMLRCNDPTHKQYMNYGGRGIKVCERWHTFSNYLADIKKLGPKPGPDYSIDRRDNDGDYEPSNIQWSDKSQQAFNRRAPKRSHAPHVGVEQLSPVSWRARVAYRKVIHEAGIHGTLQEAVAARHAKVRELGLPIICCR